MLLDDRHLLRMAHEVLALFDDDLVPVVRVREVVRAAEVVEYVQGIDSAPAVEELALSSFDIM